MPSYDRRPRGREIGNKFSSILQGLTAVAAGSRTGPQRVTNPSDANLYQGPTPSGAPLANRPQYPQYQKPSFWDNLLTQGQAGRDVGRLNADSALQELTAQSAMDRQLAAQQHDLVLEELRRTNQISVTDYNDEKAKVLAVLNANLDIAKTNVGASHAKDQITQRQRHDVLQQYGIPWDEESSGEHIKLLNRPEIVDPRIQAYTADNLSRTATSNFTGAKANFDTEVLTRNRPQLLSAEAAKATRAADMANFGVDVMPLEQADLRDQLEMSPSKRRLDMMTGPFVQPNAYNVVTKEYLKPPLTPAEQMMKDHNDRKLAGESGLTPRPSGSTGATSLQDPTRNPGPGYVWEEALKMWIRKTR